MSSSLVCQAVRFMLMSRMNVVIERFMKWGQTELCDSDRVGVAFSDCSLYWVGLSFVQGPWAPANQCYWRVECPLNMSPHYTALRKLGRFLLTTFADAGQGLQRILAMLALIARGEVIPHVMILLMGPGGEGKTPSP